MLAFIVEFPVIVTLTASVSVNRSCADRVKVTPVKVTVLPGDKSNPVTNEFVQVNVPLKDIVPVVVMEGVASVPSHV